MMPLTATVLVRRSTVVDVDWPPGRRRPPRATRGSLRVAHADVLGIEESRQQAVDLEQALAAERDRVAAGGEEVFFGEAPQLLAIPIEDIHPVLALEVRRTDRSELELQHELADEALVFGRPERAAERQ